MLTIRSVHRDGLPTPGTTVRLADDDGVIVDPRDHDVWPTFRGEYHRTQPGPYYVCVRVLDAGDAWVPIGRLRVIL